VRDGRWKLYFPHRYRTLAGRPGGKDGTPADYQQMSMATALFDLANDPGETRDVAAQHPEVVARLEAGAAQMREDLGDTLTGAKGRGARAPGRLLPGDARLQ